MNVVCAKKCVLKTKLKEVICFQILKICAAKLDR